MITNTSSTRLRGALFPPLANLVHGWVWDASDTDRRWWVEILIDDISIGVVEARLYSPKLVDAGDGCHAFCMKLPNRILGENGVLSARLANTQYRLPGTYSLSDIQSQDDLSTNQFPLDGDFVVGDDGLHLHGYAKDPAQTGKNATICIYIDDKEVCRTITDSNHRFSVTLPLFLADGIEHTVSVLSNGRPLPGSPSRILLHSYGPSHLLKQISRRLEVGARYLDVKDEILFLERLLGKQEYERPLGAGFEDYSKWYELFEMRETPTGIDSSVVLLVLVRYGIDIDRTLESLICQNYGNWRVLVTGAPDDIDLDFFSDPRVKAQTDTSVTFTRDLLVSSTVVTFIEPGDHLPSHAFSWVVKAFCDDQFHVLYTDCDEDDAEGNRSKPWFKPSWDFELFQGLDYLHNLFVVRSELLVEAVLTHLNDLPYLAVSRLIELDPSYFPKHLPRVLYHRRNNAGFGSKMGVRRRASIQLMLDNLYPDSGVRVSPHPSNFHALRRVDWPLIRSPRIAVLIPTRDNLHLVKPCVESVLNNTDYPNFQVVVLDNDSTDQPTLDWMDEIIEKNLCKIIRHAGDFNYSRLNNDAAKQVDAEVLCLLNNDTLIPDTSNDWLSEMTARLMRPGVGAVGAKLLWPNRMVQHSGVVTGIGGIAGHVGNEWSEKDSGYRYLNQVVRNASAVTAACLLTYRDLYLDLGGLDEEAYPVAFNDVDYCLRLRREGYNVVWTPFAVLFHLESQSRGYDHANPDKNARARREMKHLRNNWESTLSMDPFYHPSLSLNVRQPPFDGLAIPPRSRQIR
ncbi:glycosyltransferase family 2 protein [Thiorhodococcus fuscus]|uniref:Glycosyltransferase n=1 Tax=Thiorhodococcus fuscus TaxID=527200 RepID=A0ABW4YE60_9GAMM